MVTPRLWNPQVDRLVGRLAGTLFSQGEEGRLVYRGGELRQQFQDSLAGYLEQTGSDEVAPEAWLAHLRQQNQTRTLTRLRELSGVLEAIRNLGLTDRETDLTVATLLRQVLPGEGQLEMSEFRRTIELAGQG